MGAETLLQLAPIVLIFVVFYFLLIRPQQKKAKEHRDMVDSVKRGDQVVTAGGILGKVIKVGEEGRITVEISPNVRVEVLRSTLADVLSKLAPADSGKSGKRKDRTAAEEPASQRAEGAPKAASDSPQA